MDCEGDSAALWKTRLNHLRSWKQKHGHCTVPKAEGKLGRWVVRQRELFKKGKLEPERREQLDALGFVWNTNEAAWDYRYNLLVHYVQQNGHCCVPIADAALGMWVAKMRANYRRGKLPTHRVQKLEHIGFVWNTAEADWMDKFAKLLDFRAREGHACVPFNEGELGWWVNTQRQSKRKGKLYSERERLLNEAGFVWNPQQFLAERRRGNNGGAVCFDSFKRGDDAGDMGIPISGQANTCAAPFGDRHPPAGSDSAGTLTTKISNLSDEYRCKGDDDEDNTQVTGPALARKHELLSVCNSESFPRHGNEHLDLRALVTRQRASNLLNGWTRRERPEGGDLMTLHTANIHAESRTKDTVANIGDGRVRCAQIPCLHNGRMLQWFGSTRKYIARNFELPPISTLKAVCGEITL